MIDCRIWDETRLNFLKDKILINKMPELLEDEILQI
jgi:hypothetical protein